MDKTALASGLIVLLADFGKIDVHAAIQHRRRHHENDEQNTNTTSTSGITLISAMNRRWQVSDVITTPDLGLLQMRLQRTHGLDGE